MCLSTLGASKNKFIYYFICLIVDIYSSFFSFLENFFLKKKELQNIIFKKQRYLDCNFEEEIY